MKRILKWIGIGLASLVGLLVVAGGVLHLVGSNRLQNAPAVAVQTVEVHNSPEVLARGQRLATISSCNGCHGLDLGGQVFNDEPPLGYLPAPNLTGGAGGVGAVYTAQDWDRAIRHGVAADGRPLLIMAAHHYAAYGDEDLAALIAYLQSLPPVDKELGPRRIPFPGTIIFGLLAYNDVTSVNKIDHAAVGGAAPPAGETAEYGQYLVQIASCGSCHGEDLGGNTSPNAPQGPNITLGGALRGWSQADFVTALRTGQTPDGRQMDPEMPWPAYATLTDTELAAIWAYINSLPPGP
ncbi:MAG: hypothetical protein KatS3mg050_3359 [Litorilinea sp.]|nr:MAG: hypothetical protein KatS3mg050_3359 [Litorilinea sp.]